MRELLQFLPVLVVILVVVSMVRNAVKVVRKVAAQQASAPRTPADYDPELAERTRRIQEEIRRKIAERRGLTVAPADAPVGPRMEPPVIFAEEREDPSVTAATNAVLERQQQLANQMRALEQARAMEQRRAAQVTVAIRTESESERGLLTGSRSNLLADLRDPASLRRAFVLREVLGTPVGLR